MLFREGAGLLCQEGGFGGLFKSITPLEGLFQVLSLGIDTMTAYHNDRIFCQRRCDEDG